MRRDALAKGTRGESVDICAPARARAARGHVSYHAGLAAEESVVRHFEALGCRVVARRWRGRAGEIDLILRDGAGIVLVEVKQSRTFEKALSHLTPQQARRIYATGDEYLGSLPDGSLTDVRIDVALVDERGAVKVLNNAFGGDFW